MLRPLMTSLATICYVGLVALPLLTSVTPPSPVYAQPSPPQASRSVFELERARAEEVLQEGRVDLAIQIYERLLHLSEINEYQRGLSHMRLGKLYREKLKSEGSPEIVIELNARAAFHYLRCEQTRALEDLFRVDICGVEVKERFAPLQIRGDIESIMVQHPSIFRGPASAGSLLPRGMVSLEVRVRGQARPEHRVVGIPQRAPLDFTVYNYMPPQPKLQDPSELILFPNRGGSQSRVVDYSQLQRVSSHHAPKPPKLIGYLLTGVGVAALGAGAVIYANDLDLSIGTSEGVKWILVGGGALTLAGSSWLVYTW